MKKIFTSSLLLASFWGSAQCVIVGSTEVSLGIKQAYTAEDRLQCLDCYAWTIIGEHAKIEGDSHKKTVNISPLSEGIVTLSLSITTPQGKNQCSKSIKVRRESSASLERTPSSEGQKNVNCDILVKGFKEVKYSEDIIAFFPDHTQNNYKYEWTVNYGNGQTRISGEKIPRFPLNKEVGISTVTVKVLSTKCMKNVSKTYESSLWRFF